MKSSKPTGGHGRRGGITVRNGGVRLRVYEQSNGSLPVLLLHGLTFRADTFDGLSRRLGPEIQCWSADFRGHGASDRGKAPYLFADLVDDTVAVIRDGIGKPTVLFGHSLGGAVALAVAASAPHWVKGLVISDNFLTREKYREIREQPVVKVLWGEVERLIGKGWPVAETREALAGIRLPVPGVEGGLELCEFPGNSPGFFHLWASCLTCCDPAVARMLFDDDNVSAFDGETFLRCLQCPLLLLQADPEMGGLLADEDVAVARRLVSDFKCIPCQGVGHFMHLHDPVPTAAAVSTFLARLLRES